MNDERKSLPPNWITVTVGELGEVITGNTPSKADPENYGQYIPFVKPPELTNSVVATAEDALSEIGSEKARILPANSVLVSCIGNLGKTAFNSVPVAFNQQINAIVPFAGVEPKFVFYQAQSFPFSKQLQEQSSATTVSIVNKGRFQEIACNLAPQREQNRIISKIEELFSELDKGIEALTTARHQLQSYRLAILHQSVFDDHGFPYPKILLDELIGTIEQGWSPKCDLNRPPKDGEWAIIKTTVVQPMAYLLKECKPLPDTLSPRPDIEVHDGDILMTRKGPRSRTGVVCYVKKARPRSMLCDTVYRFRALEERIDPEYLELALNSPSVVQEIDARKSGISESGISLNHARVRSVPIPVPTDKDLQRRIVQKAREHLSVVEYNEGLIEEQIHRIKVLRQSILRRAFSGQLVAQDLNDEPASALLARICAEREETAQKKKTQRKNRKKNAA